MKVARIVASAVILAAPFAMVGDRDPARLRARGTHSKATRAADARQAFGAPSADERSRTTTAVVNVASHAR